MFRTLKTLLRESLVYGLGNIGIKLIGLLLFPLYTEKFSVDEYGIIGILDVSSQIMVAVIGLSLYSALFRFYFDKKYNKKQGELVFSILIILLVVIGVFMGSVSQFTTGLSQLLFDTGEYKKLIQAIIFSASIQALNNIPNTLLRIREKAKLYALANTARVLVILLTTIMFIVWMDSGIAGVYYGQICGNIFYLLILLPFILRNLSFRFNFPAVREMLAYSLPLVFSSIAAVILTVVDRYSLNYMSNLEVVGIYSTGYKISNILLFIVMATQLAIPTLFFKNMESDNRERLYSKVMTYNAFALMIMVIFMSIYGMEVVKVLAQDPAYWPGYLIIPYISLSVLFNSMRYLLTLNLSIVKKTLIVAVIVTIMSALNLGLNVLLIPRYQATGAAVATMVTQLIFMLVTYIISQRYYPISYELRKLMMILLIGVILIVLGYLTNELNIWIRLILKLLIGISFPFILYFLRFFEKVELEKIGDIVRSLRHPGRALKNFTDQDKQA